MRDAISDCLIIFMFVVLGFITVSLTNNIQKMRDEIETLKTYNIELWNITHTYEADRARTKVNGIIPTYLQKKTKNIY